MLRMTCRTTGPSINWTPAERPSLGLLCESMDRTKKTAPVLPTPWLHADLGTRPAKTPLESECVAADRPPAQSPFRVVPASQQDASHLVAAHAHEWPDVHRQVPL